MKLNHTENRKTYVRQQNAHNWYTSLMNNKINKLHPKDIMKRISSTKDTNISRLRAFVINFFQSFVLRSIIKKKKVRRRMKESIVLKNKDIDDNKTVN